MKKIGLFLFCFLSLLAANAQSFDWVTGGGSTSTYADPTQMVNFMCSDADGNIYALSTVGNTSITADTFSGSGYGGNQNFLITSYNCEGQMRWAKLITSSGGECIPFGIATDGAGKLYVSGFLTTPTLYIGHDTALTTYLYQSIGLIQLDTSGNFYWIRFIGNNSLATFYATLSYSTPLAIDGSNNSHLFSYMEAGIPLMPGDTSKYGVYDMTYNTAGTLLSAVRLDLDSEWYLNGAVIDPATEKLYVSGQVNQSFGYGSAGVDTFFAAAFDVSRNNIWMYFGSSGGGFSGISLDQSKHLHFAGGDNSPSTSSNFRFNGLSISNTHFPGYNIAFTFTTDTNGTPLAYSKFDANTDVAYFISNTQLPNHKNAVTGAFEGTLIDDYGHSISAPSGIQNGVLVVLDSASNLETLQQIYGDGSLNAGSAITNDKVGNVYIGGYVTDSIWADNGATPIPAYHSVGGNTSFFVMKYGVNCSCTAMPVANYTNTAAVGGSVNFSYTGTTVGLDSVVWNYGDGARGTGLTATHTYTASGAYNACVTVYTTCGFDVFCNDVSVCFPPVGSFTALPIHGGGTDTIAVTYTGTTYLLDSVVWFFGDTHQDTGITARHTYTATGAYHLCEVAYTGCGNDTVCRYDTVLCIAPPTASYTSTGTGTYHLCAIAYSACGNDTFCRYDTVICIAPPVSEFTKTGSDTLSVTYTGTTYLLDSVVWTFGDGTTGTGTTAHHTYTATGVYSVCGTVFTTCGSDMACSYDTVLCIAPDVATFSVTPAISLTQHYSYTGTSIAIDSVVWHFGDGGHGTGNTIAHTYADTGAYTVCVFAYNPCGVDSSCSVVHVDSTLGINSTISQFDNVTIFPNPVSNNLTIRQFGNSTIVICDVVGQVMYRGTVVSGNTVIDVSNWASGVYILEVNDEAGLRKMYRVVKAK